MRVLLVDHDTSALNKVTAALRGVVELDCVATKADALMLLKQKSFDVLIACERAADGSGLDLLGRIGKTGGDLQRIFSAAPERLQLLGTRLQPFNVTRTISYPIDLEELWLALAAVTSGEDPSIEGTIEHIVMEEPIQAPPRPTQRPNSPAPLTSAAKPTSPPATVAVAQGAAARKIAVEPEPEPTRRAPPAAAAPATSAPATRSVPPPAPAARVQPATKPAPTATRAAELAEVSAAAAAAQTATLAPNPKRKLPVAVFGGIAALIALGAIAAALILREPALPVEMTDAERAASAAASAAANESSSSSAGQIAALEARIEDALMREDLQAASAAQAELATLAPTHPRLAFFAAALQRASEMDTLDKSAKGRAATAAPDAAAPSPPVSSRAPPVASSADAAAAAAAPENTSAAPTPQVAASADTRAAIKNARAGNGKFQGRTLEETAGNRKASGAAASVPVAPIEPQPVSTAETQNVETPRLTDAKLIKRVSPEYPADAATRGIEGYAIVEFTVTADGKVADVKVVESMPRRAFDSAARDAVRRWRYEPATRDDQPQASNARVRLEFKLAD